MPSQVARLNPGLEAPEAWFLELGDRLLKRVGLQELEWSIALCNDRTMAELNLAHRGKEGPTDVLSFPGDKPVLGDVVISLETAARQAAALGHPDQLEHAVLLVHGLLHLMGHDHKEPEDSQRMADEECALLEFLDVPSARSLVRRALVEGEDAG